MKSIAVTALKTNARLALAVAVSIWFAACARVPKPGPGLPSVDIPPKPESAENDAIRKQLHFLFDPKNLPVNSSDIAVVERTKQALRAGLMPTTKTPGVELQENSLLCNPRGCSMDVFYPAGDVFQAHAQRTQDAKGGLLDLKRGAGRTTLLKAQNGQLLVTWFLLNPSPAKDPTQ